MEKGKMHSYFDNQIEKLLSWWGSNSMGERSYPKCAIHPEKSLKFIDLKSQIEEGKFKLLCLDCIKDNGKLENIGEFPQDVHTLFQTELQTLKSEQSENEFVKKRDSKIKSEIEKLGELKTQVMESIETLNQIVRLICQEEQVLKDVLQSSPESKLLQKLKAFNQCQSNQKQFENILFAIAKMSDDSQKTFQLSLQKISEENQISDENNGQRGKIIDKIRNLTKNLEEFRNNIQTKAKSKENENQNSFSGDIFGGTPLFYNNVNKYQITNLETLLDI